MSESIETFSVQEDTLLDKDADILDEFEEFEEKTPAPKSLAGVALENTVEDLEEESDFTPRVGYTGRASVSVDSIKDYMRQIGKTPLLSAEEEVGLMKQYEAGLFAKERLDLHSDELSRQEIYELKQLDHEGKGAYDHMVAANLRLVVSLAKRYTGRGLPFMDLVQEGNMGLIRAVEKFDYSKGFKFSTYATWWIRQAITRSLADTGRTIRVPVHMVEKINGTTKARRRMLTDLGREPSNAEVAKELDLSEEELKTYESYGREPFSLNITLGDDQETEYGDLIADDKAAQPEDSLDSAVLAQELSRLIDSLPDRHADILRRRRGLDGQEPETLGSIASSLGITHERVRQLELQAMRQLREIAFQHPRLRDLLMD